MGGSHPVLEFVHILSSTLLFGTGLGTAFAMWRAHRTGVVVIFWLMVFKPAL